jgi:hypothetical protein
VPFDPKMSEALTQYLRTFSLWCRNGFADSLRSKEALPGLLLRAYDDETKVFLLRVSAAGVVSAAPVAVGGNAARGLGS